MIKYEDRQITSIKLSYDKKILYFLSIQKRKIKPMSINQSVVKKADTFADVYAELEKIVIGRQAEVKLLLMALLSEGHVLLEDLPGMGKTTLVKAFAKILNCRYRRVPCTPDLLPSDVLGTSVFNPKTAEFSFRQGPIFTQILLVDEINRALPRTQSSFLESMEERQVSVEGTAYPLEQPFMVLATQNPIETEGTFPLPEAQLDRFLIRLRLGYPTKLEEKEMLARVGDELPYDRLASLLHPEQIIDLQTQAKQVFVHSALQEYIVNLAQATRNHPLIHTGVSPRASKALYRAVKSWALLQGRTFVLPDDIKALIVPVWNHRLILQSEAKFTGWSAESILREEILQQVALPKEKVDYSHE